MNFNHEQIQSLGTELQPRIEDALVNKVRKGFGKEIIFELYRRGEKSFLVLGLNPGMVSIHTALKNQILPFQADSFTLFLRKHLQRDRISHLQVVPGERLFVLHFQHGQKLAAQLIPKNPNLLVLDSEDRILQSQHRIPEKFFHIPASSQSSDLYTPDIPSLEQIAKNYQAKSQEILKQLLVKKNTQIIKKQILHLKKKLLKMEKDYENCLQWEKYFLFGNIIFSYHSKDSRKGIEVLDSFDFEGRPLRIPIQKSKSIIENGELFFQRSKKLKKAFPILEKRILEDQETLENLERELSQIHHVSLQEARESLSGAKKSKLDQVLKNKKIMVYENAKGFRFLTGKNSLENDLIYKLARGRDYWFHCRDYPGSHVLLWNENPSVAPDEESLKDGAALAILYSKLKNHREGFVMVTLRKYLSRTPGMEKGRVNVSRYKSLWVRIDEERLKRLKKKYEQD